MKRIGLLLAAITLLAACAVQQQKSTVDLLPQPAQYDSDALNQKDPAARYTDFEHQYREGTYQAPYWPLEAKYEGIGQLIMPPSVRPEAAWAYISLGKDFVTKGDLGGAARSYWAALELVNRTIASRPDRERIVRAAYEGLETVADARGQQKWGKLMRFCSHLADMYLDSPQAQEDNANFYAQMNTLKTAEQEMEQAQSDANSQLMKGLLLGAVAGVGAAGAFMNGTPSQFGNYVGQGVMQLSESKINYDQAVATIKDLAGKTNEQYKMIRFAAATDVEEITAANSFVGNEFLFYVKNTKDPRPYLQLLDRFAANKSQLKSVLASYGEVNKMMVTPEFLTKVRDELVQIEIFVSKYERRGKVSPPEEVQMVWLG